MTIAEGVPAPKKVTYNDYRHLYFMDGVPCKSASKVAQIPTDTRNLELWGKRMVAAGMVIDPNLRENLAVDIENKTLGDAVAEDAIKAARAHEKANRGTQMHKVLELVLLNQEERLLTEQQRRDAEVLRRTLDRYGLEPYDGMAEQFVAWPHHRVGGRFDCALRRRADDRVVMTDLKSGPNAIAYPHSTAIQLALYARAPWISDGIEIAGDTTTITAWRKHPEQLDRRTGYVLLVPADAEIGTLHEVDIDYGWVGAQIALEAVMWRKAKGYMGRECVTEVSPDVLVEDRRLEESLTVMAINTAPSVDRLRELWRMAVADGTLTDGFKAAVDARRLELAS
jgi:hypothetical protein